MNILGKVTSIFSREIILQKVKVPFYAFFCTGVDASQLAKVMFMEKSICENGVPAVEVKSKLNSYRYFQTFLFYLCLSVCLSVCLSSCMSVLLSVCLSVCLSVFLTLLLTVCLSLYHFICLYVLYSVFPSVMVGYSDLYQRRISFGLPITIFR